jgi:DNA-binding SARP family transcriptional activator
MEVRLFGQLEVVQGGVAVPVRGAKQRALLALLAVHRGKPISADRLIDHLWGDGAAANPANALQAQIGQLRRSLGPAAIVTSEGGYALGIGPDDVDVVRFEQLVVAGRRLVAEGEATLGSTALGEALALRRGEPLAEFAYAGFADVERASLEELTLVAIEARAGADLELGLHGELVGELEALCRARAGARPGTAAISDARPTDRQRDRSDRLRAARPAARPTGDRAVASLRDRGIARRRAGGARGGA